VWIVLNGFHTQAQGSVSWSKTLISLTRGDGTFSFSVDPHPEHGHDLSHSINFAEHALTKTTPEQHAAMKLFITTFLIPFLALKLVQGFEMNADQQLLFCGTYSSGDHSGIFSFWFDQVSGELKPASKSPDISNPSFLALHPGRPIIYAVSEDWSQSDGRVFALSFQKETGQMSILNSAGSGGQGPCHLALDKDAKLIVCANYGGGSVAALPIEPDGRLSEPAAVVQHFGSGPNPSRQKEPHPHCVTFMPQKETLWITDLGIDKIVAYEFDTEPPGLRERKGISIQCPPASGPRHSVFHPQNGLLYVINELDSTICVYSFSQPDGSPTLTQTIKTIPADFTDNNQTAEIVISPDGRFVYGSNRGHDSIVRFKIDEKTGLLHDPVFQSEGVSWPRHFQFSPNAKFLLVANRNSNRITVYALDSETGSLKPTGEGISVQKPVCLVFASS
jgi:6-phosphogluconolactonase